MKCSYLGNTKHPPSSSFFLGPNIPFSLMSDILSLCSSPGVRTKYHIDKHKALQLRLY